jgi:hypothetical protein
MERPLKKGEDLFGPEIKILVIVIQINQRNKNDPNNHYMDVKKGIFLLLQHFELIQLGQYD